MNRYANIEVLKNLSYNNDITIGTKYYATNLYPEVPLKESDIYVITDFGDRLDLLANQFYQDVSLYWIIAISNPNEIDFGSISIKPGTQLRIPTEIFEILDQYNELNQND
jgi:hypothetical protein